ncbi:oxidoreductase [Pseudovibrio japonicus]|uniref:Oxidoreductase n=1 Tax=Pseudovibrio japonicus TaxID=366534 RepID=A0ABQ3EBV8_9HYPH|nr:SDR family oxidoreductase [Pseudovibrio japonicus]GHB31484.1 oxidoreductase [Pseudovibrio japonicus]
MTTAKTAIVTGATSGIGEAISRSLIAKGYNVMMAARRADRLESLAQELGPNADFAVTDITKRSDVISLADQAKEKFGQIDAFINNAGIMPLSFFKSRKVEEWDRMIDVNLKGTLYGIDAVLPDMLDRQDGHIINVASIAGLQTAPGFGVYSATKFGVRALSESLRQEVAAQNVRVTLISPGTVQTELFGTITDNEILELIQAGLPYEPMKPQTIADAVLYALSQPGSACVGEIVVRPTGQGTMS